MMTPFVTTIKEPVRHAHCSFCGGKGTDEKAETVITPLGTRYRIPLSHATCKRSALSLSLSMNHAALQHDASAKESNESQ